MLGRTQVHEARLHQFDEPRGGGDHDLHVLEEALIDQFRDGSELVVLGEEGEHAGELHQVVLDVGDPVGVVVGQQDQLGAELLQHLVGLVVAEVVVLPEHFLLVLEDQVAAVLRLLQRSHAHPVLLLRLRLHLQLAVHEELEVVQALQVFQHQLLGQVLGDDAVDFELHQGVVAPRLRDHAADQLPLQQLRQVGRAVEVAEVVVRQAERVVHHHQLHRQGLLLALLSPDVLHVHASLLRHLLRQRLLARVSLLANGLARARI